MRFRSQRLSFRQTWLFRTAAIAVCASVLAAGFTASSADGCGWSGYERSLRFPSSSVKKDRLPPLPGELTYPVNSNYEVEDEPFWYFDTRTMAADAAWKLRSGRTIRGHAAAPAEARVLIATGDTRGAGKLLERFLDESAALMRDGFDRSYSTPQQPLRNQAIDLLDLTLVRMRDFAVDQRPDSWPELADFARRDDRFADNVAYLNGAFLYRVGRFDEAATAFDGLMEVMAEVRQARAALLMPGLSCARVRALATARSRFRGSPAPGVPARLMDPPGMPKAGWLAHVAVKSYDLPTGLVGYYTMLRREADPLERLEGVRSLNLVRRKAVDETMLEVERRLERDPEAALAYAYFEVYNDVPWYDAYETMSERQEPYRRKNIERVAKFASRMADRFPKGGIGAGFALRVAGACVEIDRFDDAEKFAKRALDAGPSVRERHEALYLLATAEHGARRFDSARAAIGRLLDRVSGSADGRVGAASTGHDLRRRR
ncbi:MAG: hypothetical protein IPF82_13830 [Blastocatellia bacterium]|nr:hypothetical protein [Blastocatellia bacterium]